MSQDYKLINENANNDNEKGGIKKRADKSTLKDRFSKIVSIYVPGDDSDRVLLNIDDEQHGYETNQYPKTLLQTIDENLSYQVDFFGNFWSIFGRKMGHINTVCVCNNKMFLSFEYESQIYNLTITEVGLINDRTWFPKYHDLSISPIEIRCNDQYIYVSGTINPTPEQTQYLIIKYDYDENVVACTKRYDYPKFGKFDIDKDGNLLLLTEQLDKDSKSSQISKLTSGFESRPYYITLGDDENYYKPLYIIAHGSDSKAWINLEKVNLKNKQTEYRLMCFKCCIDKSNKDELKAKLESSRWKMSDFYLGPMSCIENKVLAIDRDHHNLCYIVWNEKEGHPDVKKLSSPGSPYLVNLCSDNEYVYLFTRCSVFKFKFVEQLIKSSEMYI